MPRAPKKKGQTKPKSVERRGKGRPTKFSPVMAGKILDGLSRGKPLTLLCQEKGMPGVRTVYDWIEKDGAFSADIARAREAGFDQIALDALAIADEVTDQDTITFTRGESEIQIPNKEWILRSKLRVETRLKLLAKWDPKRYGEKIAQEISGPDGGPIQTEGDFRPSPEDEKVIRRIAESRAKVKMEGQEGE